MSSNRVDNTDSKISTGEAVPSSRPLNGLDKLSSGPAACLYDILGEIMKIRGALMGIYSAIAKSQIEAQNAAILSAKDARISAGEDEASGIRCGAYVAGITAGAIGVSMGGAYVANRGNRSAMDTHNTHLENHQGLENCAKNPRFIEGTAQIGNRPVPQPTDGPIKTRMNELEAGNWKRGEGSDYAKADATTRERLAGTDETALAHLKQKLLPADFAQLQKDLKAESKAILDKIGNVQGDMAQKAQTGNIAKEFITSGANGGLSGSGQADAAKKKAQDEAANQVASGIAQATAGVAESAKNESSKCLDSELAQIQAIRQAASAA